MSKTWRRCGDRADGPRRRSGRGADYESLHEQPSDLTVEWVLDHVAKRIAFIVRSLVETETIGEDEREEYESVLKHEVVTKFATYRADVAPGETGRKGRNRRQASAINYFQTVLRNKMLNIIERIETEEAVMDRETPIALRKVEEREGCGYLDEESAELSDGCKTVRQVDFRLDVNTLVGHLTPSEWKALKCRYCELTLRETADRLGCSEARIRRLMKKVADKAEMLGFERPKGRAKAEAGEKVENKATQNRPSTV